MIGKMIEVLVVSETKIEAKIDLFFSTRQVLINGLIKSLIRLDFSASDDGSLVYV